MPSMRSSGSSVLPFDFDIFSPSASRTMALMYTCLKGSLWVKCSDIITMRATQKKMMSKPVTSTEEGRNTSRSFVFCGQPSELNAPSAARVACTVSLKLEDSASLPHRRSSYVRQICRVLDRHSERVEAALHHPFVPLRRSSRAFHLAKTRLLPFL